MTGWNATIQQRSRKVAEWVVGPLAQWGLTPNQLTIVGLLLNAAAGVILSRGRLPTGGIAVLGASAFDLFDGALARVSGRKTRFGAFLDSTVDRYSEALLFFGLLVWYIRISNRIGVFLCYFSLLGSLMVSYTRARAEAMDLDCSVGWLQRPERMILLGVGLICPRPIPTIVLCILAVLSQATVVQRMAHVHRLTGGR